jgi:hypothetical protein
MGSLPLSLVQMSNFYLRVSSKHVGAFRRLQTKGSKTRPEKLGRIHALSIRAQETINDKIIIVVGRASPTFLGTNVKLASALGTIVKFLPSCFFETQMYRMENGTLR